MVTLICGSHYKGMLSPEYKFNIEIPYKILINCYWANCCGTSGSLALLFPWMSKDEKEILFWIDAALGQSGHELVVCTVQTTTKQVGSYCSTVCCVEMLRCWHTVGTKELLYQTNELFGILFQLNISERISKPGKALLLNPWPHLRFCSPTGFSGSLKQSVEEGFPLIACCGSPGLCEVQLQTCKTSQLSHLSVPVF